MITLNYKEVKSEQFRDNTLKCSTAQLNYITDKDDVICWKYENDGELFLLYSLVRYLQENDKEKIDLVLPYIPHARQDKRNGSLFTLKYFSEIINSLKFKNVFVFDPHSEVSKALLNNLKVCKNQYVWENKMAELSKEFDAVMYPDTGSAKRYGATDRDFIGFKHRNMQDNIDGFDLMNFKDGIKSVLIIDDICSSGMTFYSAAKLLKEKGVEHVSLMVSHCENGVMKDKLFEYVDKIYTTDSICSLNDPKIDITKLFGVEDINNEII